RIGAIMGEVDGQNVRLSVDDARYRPKVEAILAIIDDPDAEIARSPAREHLDEDPGAPRAIGLLPDRPIVDVCEAADAHDDRARPVAGVRRFGPVDDCP